MMTGDPTQEKMDDTPNGSKWMLNSGKTYLKMDDDAIRGKNLLKLIKTWMMMLFLCGKNLL